MNLLFVRLKWKIHWQSIDLRANLFIQKLLWLHGNFDLHLLLFAPSIGISLAARDSLLRKSWVFKPETIILFSVVYYNISAFTCLAMTVDLGLLIPLNLFPEGIVPQITSYDLLLVNLILDLVLFPLFLFVVFELGSTNLFTWLDVSLSK